MADDPPIDPAAPRATDFAEWRKDKQPSEVVDVENTISPKADDIPPNGGYGWVCVACCFFINGHTWGLNSSYAVFLSYYLSHNYFPGTSDLTYAFIGGLSISQALLIAPLGTWVIHVFGTRFCLHLGVFFETLSFVGASFATKQWHIILAQGLCFGWGMGFLFVASVGIIPQWFTTRRSFANAMTASGSGLGGLMYSLATQSMIDSLGLPWTFRILGIVTFAVNLTAANLLRDRNVQVGSRHKAFDIALLKRPEFLLLQGWSWFSMLGYVILIFSLPAYARSIGLTAKQGSILGAILNLGQMLGRPFIGLASDRWGRLNLATLFTFLCGVCCFTFWIPAEAASSPMGLLLFFAVVGGSLAGTFWCTIGAVGVEVVGLKDLPSGLSLTWVLMVPPTTFAEPIALLLRRKGAEWIYLPPQVFTACMYVGGALCIWVVRGWKVGELEELERRQEMQRSQEQSVLRTEKHVTGIGQDQDPLERARSQSISAAGWNSRDLLRRMVAWKIV